MTDRELLEAAAKAAGIWVGDDTFTDPIDRKYSDALGLWVHVGDLEDVGRWWSPLHKGDHALSLAVKLRISLIHEQEYLGGPVIETIEAVGPPQPDGVRHCEMLSLNDANDDPVANTRLAIVRAAAAMAG